MANLISSIAGFLRWWGRELGGLMPQFVRRILSGDSGEAIFCFDGDTLRLSRRVDGKEQPVDTLDLNRHDPRSMARAVRALFGRMDRNRFGVTLRLAPGKALLKSIDLPIAAEENLREVVAFEMDRRTPFKANDVYYDQRVVSRDANAGRINVDVAVAPRNTVEDALQVAAKWHVSPDRVEAAGETAQTRDPMNLMPEKPKIGTHVATFVHGALVTAAVGLMIAAVLIPLGQYRETADRLEAEVTQARTSAAAIEDLRAELDRLVESSQSVVERKADRHLTIEVIRELTHLLPDTSWIFQMRVTGDEVQIYGYSTAAAELLERFEETQVFDDAQFRSPVTLDARVGLERFHLSAQILGAAGS